MPRRIVADLAIVRPTVLRVHKPQLGCRLDEAFPRLRTRQLKELTGFPHRGAAACLHTPVDAVVLHMARGIRVFRTDTAPVHLEFFGNQHGHRRQHALPHLGLRDSNDDGVVWLDDQPRVDLRILSGVGCVRRRCAGTRARREMKSEQQSARRRDAGPHERAPGQDHWSPPMRRAARWMARLAFGRIRAAAMNAGSGSVRCRRCRHAHASTSAAEVPAHNNDVCRKTADVPAAGPCESMTREPSTICSVVGTIRFSVVR